MVSGLQARHRLSSHLSMHGAEGQSIRKLAGHEDLATTDMSMRLRPAALEDAIGLLEGDVSRLSGTNAPFALKSWISSPVGVR